MNKSRKCFLCGTKRAEWALQYVASDEPSLTTLGSHYRGFKVIPVCRECGEKVKADYKDARDGQSV
jgi:hypothetical protein